jgi:regulator of cell morphogenesis and NO signaling
MVFDRTKGISEEASIAQIVNTDHRTADVFRKYGIDFCCGGKWSLKMACEMKALDMDEIKKELEKSVRNICLPNTLKFEEWDIDFLTDYITNVHHRYLKTNLPETKHYLERFVQNHEKKFLYLRDLLRTFIELSNDMLPHLEQEENIIFPYIKQIAHAHTNKEPYAALLVRTLRKPVENVMNHETESVNNFLRQLRGLTDQYTPPANACISHKVIFSRMLEIDNDLVQHLYLENDILFPRAIKMEKELLEKED